MVLIVELQQAFSKNGSPPEFSNKLVLTFTIF